jgi:hypothetical protein
MNYSMNANDIKPVYDFFKSETGVDDDMDCSELVEALTDIPLSPAKSSHGKRPDNPVLPHLQRIYRTGAEINSRASGRERGDPSLRCKKRSFEM